MTQMQPCKSMEFLYNKKKKSIIITSAFIDYHWYLNRSNIGVNTSVNTERVIY